MPTQGFVVTGRVQGVGFRAFVRDTAARLGCTGEVWNRRDGAVELVATHLDAAILTRLEAELSGGPGRVDSVTRVSSRGFQGSGFTLGASR